MARLSIRNKQLALYHHSRAKRKCLQGNNKHTRTASKLLNLRGRSNLVKHLTRKPRPMVLPQRPHVMPAIPLSTRSRLRWRLFSGQLATCTCRTAMARISSSEVGAGAAAAAQSSRRATCACLQQTSISKALTLASIKLLLRRLPGGLRRTTVKMKAVSLRQRRRKRRMAPQLHTTQRSRSLTLYLRAAMDLRAMVVDVVVAGEEDATAEKRRGSATLRHLVSRVVLV